MFNAEPKTLPNRYVIQDVGKEFDITYDYAMTGEDEGWLVFTGCYEDDDGYAVTTYSHVG